MKNWIPIAAIGLATTVPHAQCSSVGQGSAGGGVQFAQRGAAHPQEQQALALLAQKEGLDPADLVVLHSATSAYPLLGVQGATFKVLDTSTSSFYGIEIDGQGEELFPEQLDQLEENLEHQMYGKLDPELHELLGLLGPQEAVPVQIWLDGDGFVGLPRPLPGDGATEAEIEQLREDQLALRRAFVQQVQAPVLQLFAGLQAEDVIVHELVPLVSATLTGPEIAQVEDLPIVTSIESSGAALPAMDVAAENIAADDVWSEGYDGLFVEVAQIEYGGRVGTAATHLSFEQDTTYSCWHDKHSRQVAAVLASTSSSYLGIAHGADLFAGGSCWGVWSQLEQQTEEAVSWGADVLNHSYGSYENAKPTSLDKFLDDVVHNSYVTMAVAAGNGGGYVESPGTAWNVITVGNYDDQGTTILSDDSINPDSDYKDPESRHDDRNKPELAAPGTSIKVNATGSITIVGSGTSLSTPMVTGAAALLMDKDANLEIWPEAVKAILMATAWNNVQGAANNISAKDGAGGIRCKRAFNVVDGSRGGWDGMYYTCSTSDEYDAESIYLEAGKRCRVVLAWAQNPDYGRYKKKPSADLDLKLRRSGSVVEHSSSYDNNFEMIDFTPSTSGYYTIWIDQYRCSKTPDWVAWAWHQTN